MTPLPPDREAVILRELRYALPTIAHTDEEWRGLYRWAIALCDRIWSHVESLHAAALVEARRAGAYEALTKCIAWMVDARGVDAGWTRVVERWRDCEYAPPRPAIAPVPLSGGRTLAWNAETKEYVVTAELAGFAKWYCYPNADRLISASAPTIADARTILAFVAQVEGVAT